MGRLRDERDTTGVGRYDFHRRPIDRRAFGLRFQRVITKDRRRQGYFS